MDTRLLLLGLLRRQDMHGYRLAEYIETNLATCVNVTMPTAYRLLSQMVGESWIGFREERVGNRPPRRVYHLLPAGEEAFESLLREMLAHFEPVPNPGDIPLAFIDALPVEEQQSLLSERRVRIAAYLKDARDAPAHPGPFQHLISNHARRLAAELASVDDLLLSLAEE